MTYMTIIPTVLFFLAPTPTAPPRRPCRQSDGVNAWINRHPEDLRCSRCSAAFFRQPRQQFGAEICAWTETFAVDEPDVCLPARLFVVCFTL